MSQLQVLSWGSGEGSWECTECSKGTESRRSFMQPLLYLDDLLTPINICVNPCPTSTAASTALCNAHTVFLDAGAEQEVQQKIKRGFTTCELHI